MNDRRDPGRCHLHIMHLMQIGITLLIIGLPLAARTCAAGPWRRARVHRQFCAAVRRPLFRYRLAFCTDQSVTPAPVSPQPNPLTSSPLPVDVKPGQAAKQETTPRGPAEWRDLFDGRTLDGWRITNFGGEGEVYVKDGQLMLAFGSPLTGVTIEQEIPTTNYEVRLEAMRDEGSDFFCGLTFPVGDSHCSFIVGGWGGGVLGLSSIDGQDASENETTDYMEFTNKKWYRIRVRVTNERIEAWIDGQRKVEQIITGRRVSIRMEVDLSRPFGIAAFDTRAALRHIQIRNWPLVGHDAQRSSHE